MQRTPWIDRKFNFDFPVGLFPNIMERLHGTECRIRQITAGLSRKELESRQDSKWSIKEEVGHLMDLESLHIGRIDDFQAQKEILRAADMTNALTNNADHNEKSIEILISDFAAKRKELLFRFELLDEEIHNYKSLHPRLQVKLRPVDIAFFIAEHDDHHLATIRQLMNGNKHSI